MTTLTPMMQQYMDCKERYPDAVLFFRLGDFYEMFFEDAIVVSKELGLTLTKRNKQAGADVPMAGVPYHAHKTYAAQLIEKGFTVAIAEQLEDPNAVKGIVKRDVVRVITPGVVFDTDSLDAKAANYVVAIDALGTGLGTGYGIAYLDVSTGDFRATEVGSVPDLISELGRIEARELLFPEYAAELEDTLSPHLPQLFMRSKHREYYNTDGLLRSVDKGPRAAGHAQIEGFFMDRSAIEGVLRPLELFDFHAPELVLSAASAVLRYIVKTQRGVPAHVRSIEPYRAHAFLIIDDSTKANLELTETLMGGKRLGSLLSVLDHTVTSNGGRRLRHWLNYPLIDIHAISRRHDALEEIVKYPAVRQDLRGALGEVYDIERLCGRLSAGTANAKDLRSLLSTLEVIPKIKDVLLDCSSDFLNILEDALDPCEELCALIDRALVEEPPTSLTDGGIFQMGYHEELDEYIDLSENGKDRLLAYETSQREETGITSLRIAYNKVFQYYIEITRANFDAVPDHYIRKQTLSNKERYFTPELKEMEEQILNAQEKRVALEYRLFEELRVLVSAQIGRLMQTASELANLDVIAGLAELSIKRDYTRPEMTSDSTLEIENGRHPVVETALKGGDRFVPNSVSMSKDRRLGIITGPNMAGKSTVIRQVALISLLAQMGSFVPAGHAKLGVVDKIFSRVGASDNLAKGQSTFMVEMTETAHILHNATANSLIILDEIGRGTATFDGLSIAWSVAEYLHEQIGAKTLFATHYHELTELAQDLSAAFNMSIAVKEWQDDIIFLRKLVDGPASHSYGIQVGRLAGLPEQVVVRAKSVLSVLEAGHFDQLQAKNSATRYRAHPDSARAPNGSDESCAYEGVSVAAMVKVPVALAESVATPQEIVAQPVLEATPLGDTPLGATDLARCESEPQLSLFVSGPSKEEELVLKELKSVSIGHMTPLQALVLLDKLSRDLQP